MRIEQNILGSHCWRNEPLDAVGVVLHWISVYPDHPNMVAGAVEDGFNPVTIMQFLDEYNRPGRARGRILKNQAARRGYASYHLVIPRHEHEPVRQFVPFDRQAYHAGVSEWPLRGLDDLNRHCEGWALVGRAGLPYTDHQYRTLGILASRGGWKGSQFTGHDHVARPEGRRHDPGPLFDWRRLREEIGR